MLIKDQVMNKVQDIFLIIRVKFAKTTRLKYGKPYMAMQRVSKTSLVSAQLIARSLVKEGKAI